MSRVVELLDRSSQPAIFGVVLRAPAQCVAGWQTPPLSLRRAFRERAVPLDSARCRVYRFRSEKSSFHFRRRQRLLRLRMAQGREPCSDLEASRLGRQRATGWHPYRERKRAGLTLAPKLLTGALPDRLWGWIMTIFDVSRYSFQQLVRTMTRFTLRVIQRNMDLRSGTDLEIVTEILGIQEDPYIDPLDDWKMTRRVWYELPGGQRAFLPSLESSLPTGDERPAVSDGFAGPSTETAGRYGDVASLDQSELPQPACE